jgi:hypothetical protein
MVTKQRIFTQYFERLWPHDMENLADKERLEAMQRARDYLWSKGPGPVRFLKRLFRGFYYRSLEK